MTAISGNGCDGPTTVHPECLDSGPFFDCDRFGRFQAEVRGLPVPVR